MSQALSFRQLPADLLPRNEAAQALGQANLDPHHRDFVKTVVDRWRGASMSGKPRQDEAEPEPDGTTELRLLRSRLETSLFRAPPSPAG